MRVRRKIIDSDGVILAEEKNGDRIKYVKAKSIEAYEEIKKAKAIKKQQEIDEGKFVWRFDGFFIGNIKEIEKILPSLDVYEKAFLYSMASYVGYEDCCLKYSNGKELDMDSMADISGISKRKLQDVVQGLIKKNILYRGKNSKTYQYFVNPWIFCKGNTINRVLKTMFKNYRIQTRDGVMWKDLKE